MSKELQSITVTFSEGVIEYSVKYAHSPEDALRSAVRTRSAARMATRALEMALENIRKPGQHFEWGGYATDFIQTTDRILVERHTAQ